MYDNATQLLLKTAMQSFWNTYYTIPDPFDRLVDTQTSTQATETRAMLGAAPMPEEWVSDDNVKTPTEYSYSAENKAWKNAVRVGKKLIKFQQWDEVGKLVANLGEKARAHRTSKLSSMLIDNGTGADADTFFSDTHEWEGAEYTDAQDNSLTGLSAVAATTPTDVEFAKAVREMSQQFWTFKDDRGDPMVPNDDNAADFVLMVPPGYKSIARRVLVSDSLTGPIGNDVKASFTLRVNPFLTAPSTTGVFYMLYAGSSHKPLILQDAGGIQFGDNLGGDEYRSTGNAVFDASWWGETVYGQHLTAVRYTVTE